ncbi:uncharacterized protein LOC111031989 [Myzus persicae]|uniref:uncharacterized protein LOC111031986 n=1 Tax=Myzus persicae TaxID=13164 RepID=UPI000B930BFC|nr:uncharacterized protein LOC111031986 [Myzus persicae]XP_022167835.1 uncharacterized protein LOC111031989 [Myzus persicae]
MIEKEIQSEADIECQRCLLDLLNEVEKSVDIDFLNFILTKQNAYDIALPPMIGSYFPLNLNENKFYMNNIVVDLKQIINIFNETKMQSESSKWKEVRKNRISASVKAHKIKTCKNLSVENQERLAETLLTEKELGYQGKINVSYGNKYESEAIMFYSKMFNNIIILKCGVIVHSQRPWLCASPDGLVIENKVPIKILEVKCPISCQNKPIFDLKQKKCNLPYLEYKNNKFFLKTTHQYYTQCQILMYCTGISHCDLLVYNKIDPLVITIEKNILFLQTILKRLEYFYFHFFLPRCLLE